MKSEKPEATTHEIEVIRQQFEYLSHKFCIIKEKMSYHLYINELADHQLSLSVHMMEAECEYLLKHILS